VKTPAFFEKDLIDNGLNSLGTSTEEKSFIQERLTEDIGKYVFTLC
jgi:hypothetical protein